MIGEKGLGGFAYLLCRNDVELLCALVSAPALLWDPLLRKPGGRAGRPLAWESRS